MTNSSGDATHNDGRASSGQTFAANDVLARRYRIVHLIGTGGTGEVYEAVDRQLLRILGYGRLYPDFGIWHTSRRAIAHSTTGRAGGPRTSRMQARHSNARANNCACRPT